MEAALHKALNILLVKTFLCTEVIHSFSVKHRTGTYHIKINQSNPQNFSSRLQEEKLRKYTALLYRIFKQTFNNLPKHYYPALNAIKPNLL